MRNQVSIGLQNNSFLTTETIFDRAPAQIRDVRVIVFLTNDETSNLYRTASELPFDFYEEL